MTLATVLFSALLLFHVTVANAVQNNRNNDWNLWGTDNLVRDGKSGWYDWDLWEGNEKGWSDSGSNYYPSNGGSQWSDTLNSNHRQGSSEWVHDGQSEISERSFDWSAWQGNNNGWSDSESNFHLSDTGNSWSDSLDSRFYEGLSLWFMSGGSNWNNFGEWMNTWDEWSESQEDERSDSRNDDGPSSAWNSGNTVQSPSDSLLVNQWSNWDWTEEIFGADTTYSSSSWSGDTDWDSLTQWIDASSTLTWNAWRDWEDWSAWTINSDWETFGFDEYFWGNDVEFPVPPGGYGPPGSNMLPFESIDLISGDRYWTNDPDLNWCKDNWFPQRVEDPTWADMIAEFMVSGNITNWCIFPGQVMVISDLSNVNLNDPNALPSMFTEVSGHCTEGVCKRQLENRKILDPGKLVERVWRLMDVYKQIGCPECFCDSMEKAELETVMAITKDHLKNNEFLAHNTTSETPENVATYFNGLKESLGLGNVTLPAEKSYIPLLDMDQAIDGPGQNVLQINKYAELAHGLHNFCGK